jgi:hypothetical protein
MIIWLKTWSFDVEVGSSKKPLLKKNTCVDLISDQLGHIEINLSIVIDYSNQQMSQFDFFLTNF